MDLAPYFKTIFGLVFVISLLFIILLFLKRFNIKNLIGANISKRLSIEEITYINTKQKIVLIKRDSKLHLLLISENHSLLIETVSDS